MLLYRKLQVKIGKVTLNYIQQNKDISKTRKQLQSLTEI